MPYHPICTTQTTALFCFCLAARLPCSSVSILDPFLFLLFFSSWAAITSGARFPTTYLTPVQILIFFRSSIQHCTEYYYLLSQKRTVYNNDEIRSYIRAARFTRVGRFQRLHHNLCWRGVQGPQGHCLLPVASVHGCISGTAQGTCNSIFQCFGNPTYTPFINTGGKNEYHRSSVRSGYCEVDARLPIHWDL